MSAEGEPVTTTLLASLESVGVEQLAIVVDLIPALVTYIDANERYRVVNRAYGAWFGHRPADLVGRTMREVMGEAAYAAVRDRVRAALAGEPVRFETAVPYSHGGPRWIEAMYQPHRDASGRVAGFVAVVSDIGDRKRAEAEREAAIERERLAHRALSSSNARLQQALAQLPAVLSIARGPDHVIDALSPAAQALLGGVAPLGRSLRDVVAEIGSSTDILERYDRVYRTGQTERSRGARYVVRGRTVVLDSTLQPLRDASGAVEGVIAFSIDVTERVLADERRELLAEAGRVLSGTLEIEAALRELMTILVPQLADDVVVHVIGDDGAIEQLAERSRSPERETDLHAMRALPATPNGPGLVAQVIARGETGAVHELAAPELTAAARSPEHAALLRRVAPRAAIVVPLLASARVLGAIVMARTESDVRYLPEDIALAEEIGRRAGVVLDAARAHAALDEAREREAFLAEAGRILAESLDVDETLRQLVRLAVPVLGDECVVHVVEPDGSFRQAAEASVDPTQERRLRALARWSGPPIGPTSRAMTEPHATPRILEVDEALLAASARDDEELELLRSFDARTLLAIPIAASGRVLAILRLVMSSSRRHHENRHLTLAVKLARRAALSLENARLYREARDAAARAELAHRTLEAVVQASPLAVTLLDREGTVRLWSGAAEQMFGWRADEVLDKPLPSVPEDHRAAHRSLLARIADGERLAGHDTVRRKADGSVVDVTVWTAPVQGLDETLCLAIVDDVTDRRRIEAERARDAERLRTLAEISRALAETSLEPELAYAAITRIVAQRVADMAAINLLSADGEWVETVSVHHRDPARETLARELFAAPSPVGASMQGRAIRSGTTLRLTAEEIALSSAPTPAGRAYLRATGAREVVTSPLAVRGRVIGAICVMRDDSEREIDVGLLEEIAPRAALMIENARLYRAAQDATRLRDEFLATVSHELRTPLNAILGWASIARRKSGDAPMLERALDTIDRNARAQAKLVDDLLDVSRIIGGKLELERTEVDVARVVASAIEAVKPSADARRVTIQRTTAEGIPPLSADAARLQQVVWNLLTNAVKFSRDGGEVRVHVGATEREVEIAVEDDGVGIAPAFLPLLFERFRQARPALGRGKGGLGLGLAIVQQLVDLHGGTVSASSDGEDRGSRFVVRLPTHVDARGSAPPEARPNVDIHLGGIRVLLVEDDEDTREALRISLESAGASVVTARHGGEALEELDRALPDVVVSDIGMPELDGYAFMRALRRRAPERGAALPAIAITAFASPEDAWRARDAGFHRHVPKPLDFGELLRAISESAPARARSTA